MWKSKQKDSWEARGQAYVIQVTKSNGKKTSKDTKNSLGKQTDWVTTFPLFWPPSSYSYAGLSTWYADGFCDLFTTAFKESYSIIPI